VASRGKAEGADRPVRQSEGAAKMGDDKGASDISPLLGAAKLQSASGADDPRHVAGYADEGCSRPWLNSILPYRAL